jgi:hypothetical protein
MVRESSLGYKNCLDAYNKGVEQRRGIKMERGAVYKIKEIQKNFSSWQREVINVGRCANGVQEACIKLRHCTREDKAYWNRHLAALISFDLGRDVVGTLHALKDDGITAAQIHKLQQYAKVEIPKLLKLADIAREDAKSNWKGLSKQLAAGTGSVNIFATAANDFVAAIVRQLP